MPVFNFKDRYCDGRPIAGATPPPGGFLTVMDAMDAALKVNPPAHLPNIEFFGHDMTGVPVVPNLDRKILELVETHPHGHCEAEWHEGGSHCRGGWAITLAGQQGAALEKRYGPKVAASLIYCASCPGLPVPNFFLDPAVAIQDMRERAGILREAS